MKYSAYILYSKILDRFYIGQTHDLNERILIHIEKQFEDSFTARANDWELFHTIPCKSRTQAIQIESHIKKMKSRKYIFDIKEYPEISDKLKIKYA
jgi:putative endonuclease